MAEAAGLAIGVAALFDTCIQSFKLVFAAQDFAKDFEVLSTSFQQQHLRLLLWGEAVGLAARTGSPQRLYLRELDATHIRPTIVRSLESIKYLLQRFKIFESRYGLKDDATLSLVNVSGSRAVREGFEHMVMRNHKQKIARAMTRWAMFDAEKMKETNESLRSLIDGLVNVTNDLLRMNERDSISFGQNSMLNRTHTVELREIEVEQSSSETVDLTRQLEALDLRASEETFHTAEGLTTSIETFITAVEQADNCQLPHTAENVSSQDCQLEETNDMRKFMTTERIVHPSESSIVSSSAASAHRQAPDYGSIHSVNAPGSHNNSPLLAKQTHAGIPSTFSQLFLTGEKLFIKHDDSNIDESMHLRVFIPTTSQDTRTAYVSIFHLRMHDLRRRDFSFINYERARGIELCRTSRRVIKRGLGKSKSGLFLSRLTRKSSFSSSASHGFETQRSPSRDSDSSVLSWFSQRSSRSSQASSASETDQSGDNPTEVMAEQVGTNTLRLQFTNYASVDLERHGFRQKKYTFEYWEKQYQWKREFTKDAKHSTDCKFHSFRLYVRGKKDAIGCVMPEMGNRIMDYDTGTGWWIPPCTLRITDEEILHERGDVCNVIVVTGIVALADNAIRSYAKLVCPGGERSSDFFIQLRKQIEQKQLAEFRNDTFASSKGFGLSSDHVNPAMASSTYQRGS